MHLQEIEGYWRLPGHEDVLAGTLRHTPEEGAVLSLLGTFAGGGVFPAGDPALIVGVGLNGKPVSLFECQWGGGSLTNGVGSEAYTARLVAVGVSYDTTRSLTLKSLAFRCTDLETWVGYNGLTHDFGGDPRWVSARYELPQPLVVDLPEGFQVKLDYRVSSKAENHPSLSFSIKEEGWIVIEAPDEVEAAELWTRAERIRDFLSLAVGRPVYFTAFEGTSEAATWDLEGRRHYKPIVLYRTWEQESPPQRPLHPHEGPLLPLSALGGRLGRALTVWLERSELLEPVVDLYFSTLYEPTVHLQRHFLLLAQAAETYHRRTTDDTDVPVADHEARMSAVLGAVPEEYRRWLLDRLRYSNEVSLRKRLRALVDRFADVLEGYVARGSFVSKVVDTRNYLTHYDASGTPNRVDGFTAFFDLIYKLRTLLEACFLSDLGLDNAEIKRILASKITERSAINRE